MMTQRVVVVGSEVLWVVSVLVGVVWWMVMWQRGALAQLPAEATPFMTAFGVMQVLTWCVVAALLRSVHRSGSLGLTSGSLVVSLALVLGNALFYFTPVVGAPLVGLVGLISAVLLLASRWRKVA
jgi:hypothetical protein